LPWRRADKAIGPAPIELLGAAEVAPLPGKPGRPSRDHFESVTCLPRSLGDDDPGFESLIDWEFCGLVAWACATVDPDRTLVE